jgi:propionyl-CoA carboxylase beta chain
MGSEGAVNVIYREEISNSADPETTRANLIAEYREKYANPYIAAARGYVDDVIEPRLTRARVISGFEMLQNKRDSLPPKKHGNIPL